MNNAKKNYHFYYHAYFLNKENKHELEDFPHPFLIRRPHRIRTLWAFIFSNLDTTLKLKL